MISTSLAMPCLQLLGVVLMRSPTLQASFVDRHDSLSALLPFLMSSSNEARAAAARVLACVLFGCDMWLRALRRGAATRILPTGMGADLGHRSDEGVAEVARRWGALNVGEPARGGTRGDRLVMTCGGGGANSVCGRPLCCFAQRGRALRAGGSVRAGRAAARCLREWSVGARTGSLETFSCLTPRLALCRVVPCVCIEDDAALGWWPLGRVPRPRVSRLVDRMLGVARESLIRNLGASCIVDVPSDSARLSSLYPDVNSWSIDGDDDAASSKYAADNAAALLSDIQSAACHADFVSAVQGAFDAARYVPACGVVRCASRSRRMSPLRRASSDIAAAIADGDWTTPFVRVLNTEPTSPKDDIALATAVSFLAWLAPLMRPQGVLLLGATVRDRLVPFLENVVEVLEGGQQQVWPCAARVRAGAGGGVLTGRVQHGDGGGGGESMRDVRESWRADPYDIVGTVGHAASGHGLWHPLPSDLSGVRPSHVALARTYATAEILCLVRTLAGGLHEGGARARGEPGAEATNPLRHVVRLDGHGGAAVALNERVAGDAAKMFALECRGVHVCVALIDCPHVDAATRLLAGQALAAICRHPDVASQLLSEGVERDGCDVPSPAAVDVQSYPASSLVAHLKTHRRAERARRVPQCVGVVAAMVSLLGRVKPHDSFQLKGCARVALEVRRAFQFCARGPSHERRYCPSWPRTGLPGPLLRSRPRGCIGVPSGGSCGRLSTGTLASGVLRCALRRR